MALVMSRMKELPKSKLETKSPTSSRKHIGVARMNKINERNIDIC